MYRRWLPIYQVLMAIIAIFAMTYGVRVNVPDFVHVKYGLPFWWGVHTLVMITGPVDIWGVKLISVVGDLVLWLALLLAGHLVFRERKSKG